TINEPPIFPMFASKTTKIKTPIQASSTLTPMPIPMSTFYPYLFPFYNYNSSPKFSSPYLPSVSNHNNSQIINTFIPTIQKF
ncbi:18132_t:CDS:1, partial [Funneliformis geosporum]